MIRVRKSAAMPERLATHGYSDETVRRVIHKDQDGKCYLCERNLGTDFQVEHLKSRKNYPGLENEWTNLFLACGYCNGKKLNGFDGIMRPDGENVEDIICHYYDSAEEHFVFLTHCEVSQSITDTCNLLDRIFNGTKPQLLTLRERVFRNEFLAFYNRFSGVVSGYLKDPTEANAKHVLDELLIEKTYLGFKYWIIRENAILKERFEKHMNWNRRKIA